MDILLFLVMILLSLTPLFMAIFWVQRRTLQGKNKGAEVAKSRVEITGEALATPLTLYGSATSGTVSHIDNYSSNSRQTNSLEYDPGKPL